MKKEWFFVASVLIILAVFIVSFEFYPSLTGKAISQGPPQDINGIVSMYVSPGGIIPLLDVWLYDYDLKAYTRTIWSDSLGNFKFADVSPGMYRIRARVVEDSNINPRWNCYTLISPSDFEVKTTDVNIKIIARQWSSIFANIYELNKDGSQKEITDSQLKLLKYDSANKRWVSAGYLNHVLGGGFVNTYASDCNLEPFVKYKVQVTRWFFFSKYSDEFTVTMTDYGKDILLK